MDKEADKNHHYSEHTGHALRRIHDREVKRLNGNMPESVPGFQGLVSQEAWRLRRSMRRVPSDGKR